ncbi:MAG: MFS transporter [Anaerolineae bacterium]|nr:MFS transporter [Anaerolineae bacterium]
MTINQQPINKTSAYTRAAAYYTMLWGSIALAGSFIAVDLNRRGINELQWSIISAVRSLTIFLVTPLVTRFADRKNARVKVLQAVLVLNGLSLLLYMVFDGFWGFLAASVIVNLMGAGMMPLGDSIIVRMARRHDIQYGRLRLWGSIGYMIFGLLGGFLWDRLGGYEYLYWAGCLATLLIAVVAARLQEPLPEGAAGDELNIEPADKKSIFTILRADLVLAGFLLVTLLRASGELLFFTFSGVYMDQLTNQAFFIGLINGGAAAVEIPTMLFMQHWIKKFGIEIIMVVGLFIQAMGLALFAFTFNPWWMFVGASLRNVGFALFFIAGVQFIDLRAEADVASTYQGMMSSISWGLAPLVISPLGGWIYQSMGGQTVFIVATLFSGIGALVMIPIMIRSKNETRLAARSE